MPLHARQGVEHLWIVDPVPRTLEVYRPKKGRRVVVGSRAGDAVVRVEPFCAVEIDLSRWRVPGEPE
jgi:hypothetical protein